MTKIKVAPSILSADFANMADSIHSLNEWGADIVHCDVMDGVYVPNITFGMPMVLAIRKYTHLPLDVHLMIVSPEKYVGAFCDAGADYVTFHPEVCADVKRAFNIIKEKGKKCGLVVNADVKFDVVKPYLNDIDILLIMTVQAGFGGQSFIESCLDKVKEAKSLRDEHGYKYLIEVDGGVSGDKITLLKDAGVDIVVAGSAVFKSSSPKDVIKSMQI